MFVLGAALQLACLGLAGSDRSGLTRKDVLVCTFTVGGVGFGLAGLTVAAGICAVLATGIWLNDNPALDQPAAG